MSLLTTQNIRFLQVFITSIIILLIFFTINQYGPESSKDGNRAYHVKIPDSISKSTLLSFSSTPPEPEPANATLDFQEIIYLSMPYRTDRQDALSLIAGLTGLKLKMIPGVSANDIHPKAQPPHIGGNNMTGTPALGVWRAHANAWRYIIDNDIQSALIIEDDVDWDVNIKQIMGMLNWQLRYNNTIRWGKDNVQKGWTEECPYGCDWDELFVGQCGGLPNQDRLDLHQVFAEPNSPNISSLYDWTRDELTQIWNLTESEGIRVVAPSYNPLCLMGYGVSRMGAMRMLYHIGGWRPFGYPVDNEIAYRTGDGALSGYTLTPPAFTSWRVGGAQDSDNDAVMDASPVSEMGNVNGESIGLKKSVRKNLENVFRKNYWEDMRNESR